MPKIRQELNIIFMGTPEFGAIILEELIKAGYKPILVVTAQINRLAENRF